jgi:2-polyprenyl-3-methyl-5-hydroxy-6-metoxy-1,4-benzoquinol methylase
MRGSRRDWVFACPGCGYLASSLAVSLSVQATPQIDEGLRESALAELRRQNFERVLDRIETIVGPRQRRVLDVGCGHGWFLDAAASRGFDVAGLEPDAAMAMRSRSKGHFVYGGPFHEALPGDDRFDIVTFNDVFEHLADPREAFAACGRLLRANGVVVLNLPSSQGALFHIASMLDRSGFKGPYERIWQKNFPSPHLSYFHAAALARLAARENFMELYRGTLPSLRCAGLWPRLRYDRKSSVCVAAFAWVGIMLMLPTLSLLPADISLQVFRSHA